MKDVLPGEASRGGGGWAGGKAAIPAALEPPPQTGPSGLEAELQQVPATPTKDAHRPWPNTASLKKHPFPQHLRSHAPMGACANPRGRGVLVQSHQHGKM